MKGKVLLLVYLVGVWVLLYSWCVAPRQALAVSYSRVIDSGARLAYLGANRAALISTVAGAASVTSPASMLLRVVTGPVGWAALGVGVGLTLMNMYYSPSDLQAVRTAASPPPSATIGSPAKSFPQGCFSLNANATTATCGGASWTTGAIGPTFDQQAVLGTGDGCFTGWVDTADWKANGNAGGSTPVCMIAHVAGRPNALQQVSPAPTQQNIADYLTSLPASSPNAVEQHTTPAGMGVADQTASSVTTVPASPTELPTNVVQDPVPSGSIVVGQNVTPPAGTQSTTNGSQSSSTTTTTTANGSTTTEATQDTATVSCTAGAHEPRTMASIYQDHQTAWQSSGLLGLVNLLKNLTWPTSLPVISLSSSMFGTVSIDFGDWAAIFTALRTLVIATTGFIAVRYVFAGGGN